MCASEVRVGAGDALIVLEAMKMEGDRHSLKDGKAKEMHVSEGGYVRKGSPLFLSGDSGCWIESGNF